MKNEEEINYYLSHFEISEEEKKQFFLIYEKLSKVYNEVNIHLIHILVC